MYHIIAYNIKILEIYISIVIVKQYIYTNTYIHLLYIYYTYKYKYLFRVRNPIHIKRIRWREKEGQIKYRVYFPLPWKKKSICVAGNFEQSLSTSPISHLEYTRNWAITPNWCRQRQKYHLYATTLTDKMSDEFQL